MLSGPESRPAMANYVSECTGPRRLKSLCLLLIKAQLKAHKYCNGRYNWVFGITETFHSGVHRVAG